jgi:hypothetical protein
MNKPAAEKKPVTAREQRITEAWAQDLVRTAPHLKNNAVELPPDQRLETCMGYAKMDITRLKRVLTVLGLDIVENKATVETPAQILDALGELYENHEDWGEDIPGPSETIQKAVAAKRKASTMVKSGVWAALRVWVEWAEKEKETFDAGSTYEGFLKKIRKADEKWGGLTPESTNQPERTK